MDNEDISESSQGTTVHCKIKRGIIWGNEETSALIKVWGEAEIKYALCSLKRNIEIFEVISSELNKLGFSRSASECRTKTKSLRKLYKQAVLHNSTSGSGRSKFLWYDEMANIFCTDTSIHPLRTTESESSGTSAMEVMQGGTDNVATLTLFEDTDCANYSYGPSETSGLGAVETSNYKATLDPATRLAMIRKRKQRSTAAARLDNTLSGFVDLVRDSDQRKEAKMSARDQEDILFQKEVINNP
ncbi:hypothetical protein JRQ81_019864 [Phrynocephalus forsythii]|uniref:Myb/SANT-like DNA-binding domain-containing protein n=1 Tax=Phrynocephalus forsythii TaxID=171643 RepID=A0A9Q0XNG7_9SAUR|nr:hypothetical protein JRQ81_019864 [Phrynocephalus forsythii]